MEVRAALVPATQRIEEAREAQDRRDEQQGGRQAVQHQHDAEGRGPVAERIRDVGPVRGFAKERDCDRDERCAREKAEGAGEIDTRVGEEHQRAGRERHEYREHHEMAHRLCAPPGAVAAEIVHSVHMIRLGGEARAHREREQQGGHTEIDHDRREHQSLRERVRVAGGARRDDRWLERHEAPHGEEKQVDRVGDQGETEHHGERTRPQQEIDAACDEHADAGGEEELHPAISRSPG